MTLEDLKHANALMSTAHYLIHEAYLMLRVEASEDQLIYEVQNQMTKSKNKLAMCIQTIDHRIYRYEDEEEEE